MVILASTKASLQDAAVKPYPAFDKDTSPPFDLTKDEIESLCKLKNRNIFVIQKAGKGNTIAIFDKDSYLKSIETPLKDCSKFKNIPVVPDKDLNHVNISEKNSHWFI